MNQFLVAVALATLLSCNTTNKTTVQTPNGSASSQEGFVRLFDGTTTNGWHSYRKTGAGKAWTAENGILHLDPAIKKASPTEGGDLVTNEE
ncbi:MAG: DUF1080 domain-containing protein, partial [Chitinophagaceae bacterium]